MSWLHITRQTSRRLASKYISRQQPHNLCAFSAILSSYDNYNNPTPPTRRLVHNDGRQSPTPLRLVHNDGRRSSTPLGDDSRYTHPLIADLSPQSSSNPFDWILRMVTPPKGFENFYPKKDDNDDDKDTDTSTTPKKDAKSNTSSEKTDPFTKFKSKKTKNKQTPPPPPSNDPQQQQQLITLTMMLLAVMALRSLFDDDDASGKEVTWSEFRNYMLEPGDVERITIINKKTARVYLRPGARGLPSEGSMNASASVRSSKRGRSAAVTTPAGWDAEGEDTDTTVMDMGPPSSAAPVSLRSGSSQPSQLVYHFNIGSVESFEEKLTKTQEELKISPRDFVPVKYTTETNWAVELLKSSPALLLLGLTMYMLRNLGGMGGGSGGRGGGMGGIFQIGKSNAKKIKKEDINVTFKDVAGCDEAKKEIMEFVDFLQDNERFTKLGAKIPKGALLCGPPGTGKTLLAKAVAGEANVPFYSISGSDFIEMFVGVGPSRVRDLFKEARANAPCIVFIDEIDAVGRQRGRGGFSGGNDERENTLNQLLVEMDGFQPTTGIVVLAGTNRVDILDQALTRPGRFDRQVTVDKPDLKGRKEIFQVHLKGLTLSDTIDEIAPRLAGLTPGMAGADIANLCNEAAIQAARRKAEAVSMVDFEKATDRIIGGLESNKIMSDEERSVVAHHEAGHAVAGWFLEHADPLLKVTIIPRSSGALGYAQYLPKEIFLRTRDQIMDIVCMALAGRAAEDIFFGRVTTGAADDLRRVTDIVYQLIQVYGMNDRVGQLAFPKDPNAMPGDKPYSDATAQTMDEEAKLIVDQAYKRTLELLKERKEEVEKVALMLLEKETITHDDVMDLIGERPFVGDKQYTEFVSRRRERDPAEEKEEELKEEETTVVDDNASGGGPVIPGLAFKGL